VGLLRASEGLRAAEHIDFKQLAKLNECLHAKVGPLQHLLVRSSAALAAMIQGKYDKKHERRPLAHLLSFGHDEPSSYFRVGIMSKSRWSGDFARNDGLT
jgi:hypothetical protein